jgi:tetratricopeptide (TPR) repeat protein
MMKQDRIRDLADKAAKGDREAYGRLLDLDAEGVRGARAALLEIWDSIWGRGAAGGDSEDRQAFWSELRSVKEDLNREPAKVGCLDDLRARAREWGTCEAVQADGLEAYRLRLLEHLEAARELLEQAWRLGGACALEREGVNPCRLDVGRRLAVALTALGQYPKALATVEESLGGYQRLGGPGHDLDGDGIANCLSVRAQIRSFMGDPAGAAGDFAVCLDRRPTGSNLFDQTRRDLAWALFETGDEGKEDAYKYLQKHRLAYRRRELTPDRAQFDWLDGELEFSRKGRVGRNRRKRGEKKMMRAIEGFAEAGLPAEFEAAASDLLKALRHDRTALLEHLETLHPMAMRLIKSPEQLRRFQLILNECQGTPSPSTWSRIERAIGELREAAGGTHLPPCLIR